MLSEARGPSQFILPSCQSNSESEKVLNFIKSLYSFIVIIK